MERSEQIRQRLTAAIGERYEVLDPIGVGGMATVFLTRHRMHGGFCAVKVLADHLAQQEPLVKSFLTEAQASAALDAHPNIVNIVDIDHRDGLYYMVMKYVEGEDLSSYLNRKGKLTWQQAAYVAAEVADALSYAHERGVIHRDLKPSNVRLSMHGGVTVLDFGIAKIGQTPSSFTEMGARAGTPHYMAPEQVRGQSVDHRSDLYSLGVMLYQMALGQRPFDGENREAIWYAHATMEPPTPREIDPHLPEPLSHIILSLLQKDPENRYESASRVTRHLRTLGLEGVTETLEPVDQLGVDEIRTRTITPTALTGERTPIDRPKTSATQPDSAPPAQPVAAGGDSKKMIAIAAAAVALVLAIAAWLVLGSSPQPAPEPPPAVKSAPTPEPTDAEPAPAAEPSTPRTEEAQTAQREPQAAPPEPPPAEPAGPTAEEREAARRRAEAARRRRAQEEARRQAEIEAAKARLRGEIPAEPDPQ